MAIAYLGLGSNVGDRAQFIEAALARLAQGGVRVEARSPLYETDAVAPEPQAPYLNAAVRVAAALLPRPLLELALDIERSLGRRRPPDRLAAPREIDIDLLLYGTAIVDEPPDLLVPHPRLLARPFVRVPLSDVAVPGLVHPVTGEPLDRAAPSAAVRRYARRA